jgi:outer membrane protein TolC
MRNSLHTRLACIAMLAAGAAAGTLTEQDAIRIALEHNTSVRVARIDRATDSLALAAKEADFLPQLSVGADLSWTPAGEGTLSADVSAAGSQAIPGGGGVSGAVEPSAGRDLETGKTGLATTWSLGVRQPLAAGAWRYGQPDYELAVQRVASRESDIRFRQSLANSLGTVRERYWSCYESARSLSIAAEAMAQAERMRTKERIRFVVGDAAMIDTLRAALEYLQSEQALLSAEAAFSRARRSLAAALMIPPDSLAMPETLEVSVAELPASGDLLAAVRAYDPQRSLFDLAYEKLQMQYAQQRNGLLPQVDLQASYRYTDHSSTSPSVARNSVFSLIASYALPTKKKRISAAQMQLSMERKGADAAQYERELADQVAELEENWSLERRRLASAQLAADVARRSLEVAEKSYEIGSMDQLSYLQARQDAFDALTGALQQSIDLKRQEIVFDELTGAILSRFGVRVP